MPSYYWYSLFWHNGLILVHAFSNAEKFYNFANVEVSQILFGVEM